MNQFTNGENVKVLKTKVTLTISNPIRDDDEKNALFDLMVKSLMVGCSVNMLNQVLSEKLSTEDWEVIKESQLIIEKEIDKVLWSLKKKERSIRTLNHRFF